MTVDPAAAEGGGLAAMRERRFAPLPGYVVGNGQALVVLGITRHGPLPPAWAPLGPPWARRQGRSR